MQRLLDHLAEAVRARQRAFECPGRRARVLLVLDAVRSERMTWRAAASALGLAPSAFLDLARDQGVPTVRASASDVSDDLATLDRLGSPRRS